MLLQSKSARLTEFEHAMKNATSYEQWKAAALEHDAISGKANWKRKDESDMYDFANIQTRLAEVRSLRKSNDNVGLLFALNEGIHGNMGGMGKPELYEEARFGTKRLIEDYVEELAESLKQISSLPENEISLEDKLDFFGRASQCFGRSALMLSGAGSVIAAVLGTHTG